MNLLIDKNGQEIRLLGATHSDYCKLHLKQTLEQFLVGGVRIKTYNSHMTIEAGLSLTTKQKEIINRELNEGIFYSVLIYIGRKYTTREANSNAIRRI